MVIIKCQNKNSVWVLFQSTWEQPVDRAYQKSSLKYTGKYLSWYIILNISKDEFWQQFYQIWFPRRDKFGDECYFQIALTLIKWLSFQLPVASDHFQEMAWLALAGLQHPPNSLLTKRKYNPNDVIDD